MSRASAANPSEFAPATMSPELDALRTAVRGFLADTLDADDLPGLGLSGHSPTFSRRLGERGWIGMALPVEYGGQGR